MSRSCQLVPKLEILEMRRNSGSPSRDHKAKEERRGTPAGGFAVAWTPLDIARSALLSLAPDRQPMSSGVHGPPQTCPRAEGFPGCVIPRWLRGQPGQSARHPTPFLAFLTPEA